VTSRRLLVRSTVDTEIWPFKPGWPNVRLEPDDRNVARQYERCILGATDEGEFGVRYQLAVLNRYGLRATFFVEPLHAAAVGGSWLREIVGTILDAGHDVQLHAHTEWLSDTNDPGLPTSFRQHIREYSLDDQIRILAWARRRLESCGVREVVAFRAGNFGANRDTLRALARIGVGLDSSYNRCYVGGACGIDVGEDIVEPRSLDGVLEVPLTVFSDYPGHYRPAHLGASSTAELEHALEQAWTLGWSSFVILWHPPDLLKPGYEPGKPGRPSATVIERFESMCRFLGAHRDRFETRGFGDIDVARLVTERSRPALKSTLPLTLQRMVQQAIGRFA
jgi:peptidoglycan/xylan/chitin deacetylase (PgdA/CDA1 family)